MFEDSQGILYGLHNYGDVTADVIGVDPEVDIVNADIEPHLWYSDGTRVDVKTIKEDAFGGCRNLISVKIPDTVTKVERNAFFDCNNLKRVEVGKGMEKMEGSNLGSGYGDSVEELVKVYWRSVTPPEYGLLSYGSVNYVPDDSYLKYYNFRDAYVYDRIDDRFEVNGLIYIPYDEDSCDLVDCDYTTNRQEIKISNEVFYNGKKYSVRNLRPGACYGNKVFKKISFDFDGDIPYSMCTGCGELEILEIPSTVREIGGRAFAHCYKLENIELKNCGGVGQSAFYRCNTLKNAIVHESVAYLGSNVFPRNVGTLTNYNAIPTKLDSNALSLIDKDNCILHIPQGSLDRYRSADSWKDFKNIVEDGIPAGVDDISALTRVRDKR